SKNLSEVGLSYELSRCQRVKRRAHGIGRCRWGGARVVPVEDIERLEYELQPCVFRDGDFAGEPGIEAHGSGRSECVPSQVGCAIGAIVAVIIQVRVDQARVGLAALGGKNSGDLPSFENAFYCGIA